MKAKELKVMLAEVPDDADVVVCDVNWRSVPVTGGWQDQSHLTFMLDIEYEFSEDHEN